MTYTDNGQTVYELWNLGAEECLANACGTLGSRLTMSPCTRFGAGWLLIPVSGPTGQDLQLEAAYDGTGTQHCAAASDFTDNNHTPLIAAPCSSPDTRQRFRLSQ